MYLGNFDGKTCTTSVHSPNEAILCTGIPGSGKTCCMNKIELHSVKEQKTVIIIDMHQTHSNERILHSIYNEYSHHLNRISVIDDGLNVSMLEPIRSNTGALEPFNHLVNSAVHSLSANQNMGSKQVVALRNAIIKAIQTKDSYTSESVALATALIQKDDEPSLTVYNKLWEILNNNILHSGNWQIQKGRINIFDFIGVDDSTQTLLSEILLQNLWRKIQFAGEQNDLGEIIISIDELHNMSLEKDGILRILLREGRKFGVNLLLATQTLCTFPKEVSSLLKLPATHLYFQPTSNEIIPIAKEIRNSTGYDITDGLANLRIGECIATGTFSINGIEIRRPLLLK